MYKSQTLNTIRQQIDTIDNTIHDLLMERAALASSIAAEKRKRGMPVVHPAREARMIRRLLTRHKGDLPKQAVTRIWRELVSAVSMLQSGLKAQFFCSEANKTDLKTVTDYFGSILPATPTDDSEQPIKAVAARDTDFAIVPYTISSGVELAWLPALIEAVENDGPDDAFMPISVVQSIPFILSKDEVANRYLVVARTYFDTSEDDYSFIALKANAPFDLQVVEDALQGTGLNSVEQTNYEASGSFYMLIKVDGFVDSQAQSVAKLQDLLGNAVGVYAIGGCPKPIYV